jgi:hypothetical protein
MVLPAVNIGSAAKETTGTSVVLRLSKSKAHQSIMKDDPSPSITKNDVSENTRGEGAYVSRRVCCAIYGIFFTGLVSRLNSRAALPPRMLRLAFSFRNGRS